LTEKLINSLLEKQRHWAEQHLNTMKNKYKGREVPTAAFGKNFFIHSFLLLGQGLPPVLPNHHIFYWGKNYEKISYSQSFICLHSS